MIVQPLHVAVFVYRSQTCQKYLDVGVDGDIDYCCTHSFARDFESSGGRDPIDIHQPMYVPPVAPSWSPAPLPGGLSVLLRTLPENSRVDFVVVVL